jgi:hypothetical protein
MEISRKGRDQIAATLAAQPEPEPQLGWRGLPISENMFDARPDPNQGWLDWLINGSMDRVYGPARAGARVVPQEYVDPQSPLVADAGYHYVDMFPNLDRSRRTAAYWSMEPHELAAKRIRRSVRGSQ